jgi:predicted AAA+ superfamily ATPase
LSNTYYDLELESDRLRLDLDWRKVVSGTGLVVLDEAQCFPEIFPRIRSAIDGNRQVYGRFFLLGSVAPSLMHEVSESLLGRAVLVEMGPLCLSELPESKLDDLWRCQQAIMSGTYVPWELLWEQHEESLFTVDDRASAERTVKYCR